MDSDRRGGAVASAGILLVPRQALCWAAQEETGQRVSYDAAMLLLRARVFEAQENRARAVQAYSGALALDPFCYEAFQVPRACRAAVVPTRDAVAAL